MADYPTRGFSIEQPTIAEMQLTGWFGTARFERRGHRYDIGFNDTLRQRGLECLRDGKPIAWDKLNSKVQSAAHKAGDFLRDAYRLAKDAADNGSIASRMIRMPGA